jgi:hypothetical protein
MNLIDAIRLYTHIVQQYGGGYDARLIADRALKENNVPKSIRSAIASTVSNDGHIIAGKGGKFAITQIAAS